MLQPTWKLSQFANGEKGLKSFAKGLAFQAVCKQRRRFVTRLDAKDRFRMYFDLTSLSIVRTMTAHVQMYPIPGLCKLPS